MYSQPCQVHPDREGVGFCFKQRKAMCEECLRCSAPEEECRFRSGCLVWEFTRLGILPASSGQEEDRRAANGGEP